MAADFKTVKFLKAVVESKRKAFSIINFAFLIELQKNVFTANQCTIKTADI